MDIQIDIRKLQFFEARINSSFDIFNILNHFGRDKELIARNIAFLNSNANLFFRVVNFGSVQMAKPNFNGRLQTLNE